MIKKTIKPISNIFVHNDNRNLLSFNSNGDNTNFLNVKYSDNP
jgi:hypothetical protein